MFVVSSVRVAHNTQICETFVVLFVLFPSPYPHPNTTKANKTPPTTKVKKVPETNHTPKPKNQAVKPKNP
jgi:hypothetical protein